MSKIEKESGSQSWLYLQNELQCGPVGIDELKSKVGSGEIQPSTLLWTDGLTDWVPAIQVEGLFVIKAAASSNDSINSNDGVAREELSFFKKHIFKVAVVALMGVVIAFFFLNQKSEKDGVAGIDSDEKNAAQDVESSSPPPKVKKNSSQFRSSKNGSKVFSGDNSSVDALIRQYFLAKSAKELSTIVYGGEDLSASIEDFNLGYRRPERKIIRIGDGEEVTSLNGSAYKSVLVEWENQGLFNKGTRFERKFFYLEKGGKYYLDWESADGVNKVKIANILDFFQKDPSPIRLRVRAKLDDYYNYQYSGMEDKLLSISVSDLGSRTHAYVSRSSDIGKRLREDLSYEKSKNISILARLDEGSEEEFLIIDEYYEDSWRPEAPKEKLAREQRSVERAKFLTFARQQMTIDDVLAASDKTPKLIAFKRITKNFRGLKGIDFEGRSIDLAFPETGEIAERLKNLTDGDGFQDELIAYVVTGKESGGDAKITILDVVYTGVHVETDQEKAERELRVGDLAARQFQVFGDERDRKLMGLKRQNLVAAFNTTKGGGKPQYDSVINVLLAFSVALPGDRFPKNLKGQKQLVKTVLGAPDQSDTESFNRGNFVKWRHYSRVLNPDTEKYTEDVSIVFAGDDLLIFVEGPAGLGSVGGGIRSPIGSNTRTYESLENAVKRVLYLTKD